MSVALAPSPVFQGIGFGGLPLPGGKLFTYAAGTSTPQATYVDSTQTTPNANPVILNANGQANVWLVQGQTYKLILQDALGNQIWSVDQISGGTVLTQQVIGQILFPQNAAEAAAGIVPTNFYINRYKDVPVERYGVTISNVPNGAMETANTAGMNKAISVALAGSDTGGVIYMPEGTIRINDTLSMAAPVNWQGSGKGQTFLNAIGFSPDKPILAFNGSSVNPIDSIFVRNFALASDNNQARGISATWVKNSAWDDLYFFQLFRGWVGATSFGTGFRNNNSFGITDSCYILGSSSLSGGCANTVFDKCRMVGVNGISVNFSIDSLLIEGCDFEGITTNGAGVLLLPPTLNICSNVSIIGSHFENINGTAIFASGTDANSITGLVVKGNFIKGGFGDSGNTNAVNAIFLSKANGFDISDNNFMDWGTQDASAGGTQGYAVFLSGVSGNAVNGVFENNTSAQATVGGVSVRTVKNWFDIAPDKSTRLGRNWTPVNGTGVASSQENTLGQSGLSGTNTAANNLRGTASFSAATTSTVTFAVNEPDASFFVSVTFTSDPGATNTRYWVSAKGTTGFTVNVPVNTSASYDWHLIR